MEKEMQSGMHCAEFETLLFEAIEGKLVAGTLTRFEAHVATCISCGPLFADVQAGQQWMRSLADVEAPKNLIHNILARTSGVEERYAQSVTEIKPSFWQQALGWARPVLSGTWATVRQPRFGMSVAMAFFSVSLVMSVTGIKVKDIAKADLRPSALKRGYYSTQARVVKYYTNMRFVYDIESRLHDIQRATAPAESAPKREEPKERRKDNSKTSSRPSQEQDGKGDRNQDKNYAQDQSQPVVARWDGTGLGVENADGTSVGTSDGIWQLESDAARREA